MAQGGFDKPLFDLQAVAFQGDITRVSALMYARDVSLRAYPESGVSTVNHSSSHHGEDPKRKEDWAKINRYHLQTLAYFMKKLQSVPDGDGTLLDNCMMMWGSGLEDGNGHTRENLPFIIAGKGGGALKTGRFINSVKANQGDLLTTLLTCAGVPLDRPIGIATKQITEMTTAI